MTRISVAAAWLALSAAIAPAHAGEVYSLLGIPGVGLGYAQPLNSSFTLRGDLMTLGTHRKNQNEEGIDYAGTLKTNRGALFGDWFPFEGTFRVTGGVSFNTYSIDLLASGAGKVLDIGDNTYTLSADDRFNVNVNFPKTTPYLGIGWGHQMGSGFRFSADIGAMIGRAKVKAAVTGPLKESGGAQLQSDIDSELMQLREGVGKVRALPQLSLGIGYSF